MGFLRRGTMTVIHSNFRRPQPLTYSTPYHFHRCLYSSTTGDCPTDEEVNNAHRVLGTKGMDFAEARRRYLELAKQHHPDVKSQDGSMGISADRMSEINQAYSTLQRKDKHGGLRPARSNSNSNGGGYDEFGGSGMHQPPYGYNSPHMGMYQAFADDPYWENTSDFHEAMQAAMNGRMNSKVNSAMWYDFDDFFEGGIKQPRWRDVKKNNKKHHHNNNNNNSKPNDNKTTAESSASSGDTKSTSSSTSNSKTEDKNKEKSKLTDDERSALKHMYEEGKSFEFISNALGKPPGVIVTEYNLMSKSNSNSNRSNGMRGGRSNGRGRGGRGGPSRQYQHVPWGAEIIDDVMYSNFDDAEIFMDPAMCYDQYMDASEGGPRRNQKRHWKYNSTPEPDFGDENLFVDENGFPIHVEFMEEYGPRSSRGGRGGGGHGGSNNKWKQRHYMHKDGGGSRGSQHTPPKRSS
eukprot:Tbor_TRINITY_DN5140_c3_g4::TRINITY_DN5140_c3_g4_i1::g.25959::m.25959